MDVRTVTTSDRSLLHAVRGTLDRADEAFLCVAFVQERGLHLLERELETLQRHKAPVRLLVTTTFQATSPSALVHRSSAVCAILARLPPVERVPGKGIALRWR